MLLGVKHFYFFIYNLRFRIGGFLKKVVFCLKKSSNVSHSQNDFVFIRFLNLLTAFSKLKMLIITLIFSQLKSFILCYILE